jgi:uncharacterized membrane protein
MSWIVFVLMYKKQGALLIFTFIGLLIAIAEVQLTEIYIIEQQRKEIQVK